MTGSLSEPQSLLLPGNRSLSLERPLVMAIINITDDSFHAASRVSVEEGARRALTAVTAGADIVDLGAESSRPGAAYVTAKEELERLIPVLRAFRKASAVPVSIDTRKAEVAEAALAEGADIINDISAMGDDGNMAAVCARAGASVVLMHKQGTPLDMQQNPRYADVVSEIATYLEARAARALADGIDRRSIVLDPGIGFGKLPEHNLQILARLAEISRSGYPVLMGLSRKSFLGAITARDVGERLAATIAANYAALCAGAQILRVHDVAETVDLIKMFSAIRGASGARL